MSGAGFTRVSVSAVVISRSKSSRAFLNSPMLLPTPRASSGNFFAPKSNKMRIKMMTISWVPRDPKKASTLGFIAMTLEGLIESSNLFTDNILQGE